MAINKGKKSKSKVLSTSKSLNIKSSSLVVPTLQEKCKRYYRNSKKKYNEFFLKCVEEIEGLQPNAFACVQVMRYFVVGMLPQYCTIPDPLTKKQRERVERILAS